jgi:LPXTG-site transpeptidase (sortase) family protein
VSGSSARSWVRRTGFALVAVGLVICLIPVGYLAYGNWQQSQINQRWRQELRQPAPAPASGLLFAIRVPKIGYYAAVQQGVSLNILYAGPGHYPQTVLPGEVGTVGVAAHNTYWIKFGNLTAGDQIQLQTRTQTYSYTITGTQVVQPSDVAVLNPKPGRYQLVMTTCWPLWAGALAQQRLVFFATQNGT